MKSYVVAIALLLLACQDSGEEIKANPATIAAYRKIGMEIPFETGMQWMECYKKNNSQQGRLGLSLASFVISDDQVEDMIASVSNPVGVAFHYAEDASGELHIIAIPVDETLRLWTSIPGRIYVDANSGDVISQSLAESWAQNYKDEHPADIWFHFFGQDTMEAVVAVPFFNSMAIEPALDILNLSPQLLLIVWNQGTFLGRQKGGGGNGVVFDASSPCPPCNVE